MLRPHGGPQNHLLRNATIIVMFRIYLNRFLFPFMLIVFGVTLRIWQLRLNTTGNSSHFLIYPYAGTPWGGGGRATKPFVTECHYNSSIPYVPGHVLIGIRTKGFWCNTLILAVVPVHNRKSSHFLVQLYARSPWGSSRPFATECHHNSSIPYVPGNVLVGIRTKGFCSDTLNLTAVPVHNRKSSHFFGQPYAQTPWGSSKPFVTECHHNSYVPYVS